MSHVAITHNYLTPVLPECVDSINVSLTGCLAELIVLSDTSLKLHNVVIYIQQLHHRDYQNTTINLYKKSKQGNNG